MPKALIAVVSPFIDKRHGTERSVAECLELLSTDFEIHLYSQSIEDVDLAGIVWHRVPGVPGPHLFRYAWWFIANHFWRWRDRRFRKLKPDLVFSPGINCLDADAIQVHVVFAQLRRQMKAQLRFRANPLRTWPQVVHRRIYYRLIAFLERRIYPRADLSLAVVSRKTADDLRREYGRSERVHVGYYGLDLRRFHPSSRENLRAEARRQLNFAPGDFVLLLIGNDWKSKGLDCLLDAVRNLNSADVQILVAGNGDPGVFQEKIRNNALAGRVHFLPPRADVEFYYAAADAYVSPSFEDSFGLPVAEAMACGLPAITSRFAGVAEIIHSDEDGFVLDDPRDFGSLAEILGRLLLNPELRQRIACRAVETAQTLSWRKTADSVRACWDEALCLKRSAALHK